MNIDWNIIIGTGVVFGLFIFFIYVKPFLKNKNMEYYEELELALLICGFAFRDEKLKKIFNVGLDVVTQLEKLSLSPSEKHIQGVKYLSIRLLDEFSINLSEEALDIIIRIAVKTLPPTN